MAVKRPSQDRVNSSLGSPFNIAINTPENHCTRTVQSSRVGCNRRVHRICLPSRKKGNILVNILLLKNIFRSKILPKILPFLTDTILCTRRLQPTRDDCAVQVQGSLA